MEFLPGSVRENPNRYEHGEPECSRAIAAKVREKGADMVDAPVSGSVITLQKGKLFVMVGGPPRNF